MKLSILFYLLIGQIGYKNLVTASDVCYQLSLKVAVEIEGKSYSNVQLCNNGYIKFGEPQNLTEPDFLGENISGAVFAPLLHDIYSSDPITTDFVERVPGDPSFETSIRIFYEDVPEDPDFNVDWYLMVLWASRYVYDPRGSFFFRIRMAQDSNYKNLGHARIVVLFKYEDMEYTFVNTNSGQMSRAGVNGENFGEQKNLPE